MLRGLTVDSLIFGSFIGIMEIPQNFDEGEMRSCVVDDSLGTILDEEFEEDESFVDLSPLTRFLFGESRIERGHDFVE